MAQHDFNIANATFPSVRSDINSVLTAINTSQSGTSRPSSAVAGTIWLDTTSATTPTLKFYDGTDDISLATFDYSANTVNWLDSTVVFDIVGDTTPQLGGDLDVNGNSLVSVSDGNITFTPDGTGKVVISGLSFPTSDGSADQVLKTDGSGNLSFTDLSGGTSWQSVKTSGFTAVSGEGYPCNTSSSAFTVTLPSSASIGDYVVIADYGSNASSNNITIDPNGLKILGTTGDRKIKTNKEAIKLVYIDATKGWIGASGYIEGTLGLQGIPDAPTIGTATATGNTTATVVFTAPANNGDATITSYTSTSTPGGVTATLSQAGSGTISVTGLTAGTSYTFKVTATNSIGTSVDSAASNSITTPNTYSADMLVIAGGGGGGAHYYAGGGGAGGYRTSTQSITGGATYSITVGDGGAGSGVISTTGGYGSNSSISGTGITTITSTGGGGGGAGGGAPGQGHDGGSGGGNSTYITSAGGSGNTPSTSPSQGNNGGSGGGTGGTGIGGGGGGGASAVGGNQIVGSPATAGSGGNGTASSITGSSVTRAGGGGGASNGTNGSGGTGGGGGGASFTAISGTVNTGGGGGGQGQPGGGGAGNGGKGVVILSIPDANYTGTTAGSPTVATGVSGKTILTFTGTGSYTA